MIFYADKTIAQAEMALNSILRSGGRVWIKDGTGNTAILTEGIKIGYAYPVQSNRTDTWRAE